MSNKLPEFVAHLPTRQFWTGHCPGCCNQVGCIGNNNHICPNSKMETK